MGAICPFKSVGGNDVLIVLKAARQIGRDARIADNHGHHWSVGGAGSGSAGVLIENDAGQQ